MMILKNDSENPRKWELKLAETNATVGCREGRFSARSRFAQMDRIEFPNCDAVCRWRFGCMRVRLQVRLTFSKIFNSVGKLLGAIFSRQSRQLRVNICVFVCVSVRVREHVRVCMR